MSDKQPKILIIEDSWETQELYRQILQNNVLVLAAFTIEEGERLFEEHHESLALIVMDACVPGDHMNTDPLTRSFRQRFNGPMLAASGSSNFRNLLMTYGCTHEAPKADVPAKILEILELT